ncbi:hypothetical protein OAO01_03590 [Oligoflexia bacterium]|nr:hypothetical protein [Oligoflexia bacterium]
MNRSSKVIDYLDLSVVLPDRALELFQKWLDHFEEAHDFVERSPRLKNKTLLMNSTDLITFMGYVDPAELSEFEFFQFKNSVKQALEQLLLKSLSLDHQNHYKWCLAALNNLEVGRFLKNS